MSQPVKIGVLGGQQGSRVFQYAADCGFHLELMSNEPQNAGRNFVKAIHTGDPASFDDVMAFAAGFEVIAVGAGYVNTSALHVLERQGVHVYPSASVVDMLQDRFIQKQLLQSNGLPVVPGVPVLNRADLYTHVDKLPGRLRKCQAMKQDEMVLAGPADIANAFDEPSVLEEIPAVKHRFAVIIFRDKDGTVACYDPVLMVGNKDRLLFDFRICSPSISNELAMESCNLAMRTAEAIDLTGMLVVEMLVTDGNALLIDELSLRPRKSADSAPQRPDMSLYEKRIRAVLNLSLGDKVTAGDAMVSGILEPAALRRFSIEQAVRDLIGIAASKARNCDNGQVEEALLKAVIIRYMLEDHQEEDVHGVWPEEGARAMEANW